MTLQPGETRVVRTRLTAKEFAYWDTTARAWRTESHAYTFLIGPSSKKIFLTGEMTIR